MKKSLTLAVVLIAVILISSILIILNNKNNSPISTPTIYTYQVINEYSHDANAFTEGLVFENGYLYESTGSFNSQSTLRRVNLETGNILQQHTLPSQYFAEGITIFNDKIIQLTWQEHIGFIYDQNTFKPTQNFTYQTEGWGLTNDGNRLIMSDGTANLYFLNPKSLLTTNKIIVHDPTGPVDNLNELEYINGKIYANQWKTNNILIINPQNGQITGKIDLAGIENITTDNPDFVLNGIAYNPQNNTLLVTGKMWPHLFEVTTTPTT